MKDHSECIQITVVEYLNLTQRGLDECCALLPYEDKLGVLSIDDFTTKCERAVTRLAVRSLLTQTTGLAFNEWTIHKSQLGKPDIRHPDCLAPISFNLSHSCGYLAVAVGKGYDLGIDVEPISRAEELRTMTDFFLTDEEAREIGKLSAEMENRALVSHWTIKEAISKAIGLGLQLQFETLNLRFVGPKPSIGKSIHVDTEGWYLELLEPVPNLIVALAAKGVAEETLALELKVIGLDAVLAIARKFYPPDRTPSM